MSFYYSFSIVLTIFTLFGPRPTDTLQFTPMNCRAQTQLTSSLIFHPSKRVDNPSQKLCQQRDFRLPKQGKSREANVVASLQTNESPAALNLLFPNKLNYEILFEVQPHHQFVPHEPNSSTPGASSTLLSSTHPPGHQNQVGTAKKTSIARKAHNLSPELHAAKRPRPLQNNLVLVAVSDFYPSAFKPVLTTHKSKPVGYTTDHPRFVKNGSDFGHRRRPNTTSTAVPPQQVSGVAQSQGVPDTLPVMVTTPSQLPSYASALEHLVQSTAEALATFLFAYRYSRKHL
jgi:hypothetical protein